MPTPPYSLLRVYYTLFRTLDSVYGPIPAFLFESATNLKEVPLYGESR